MPVLAAHGLHAALEVRSNGVPIQLLAAQELPAHSADGWRLVQQQVSVEAGPLRQSATKG